MLQPPGGTLVFVCPVTQVYGKQELCEVLDTWWDKLELFLFPDDIRKYRECVIIARRRKQPLPSSELYNGETLHNRGIYRKSIDHDESICSVLPRLGDPSFENWSYGRPNAMSARDEIDRWTMAMVPEPKRFEQFGLTNEQIDELLAESPLYGVLKTTVKRRRRRPPMPLNEGHTSLLILTGLLDGYVPSNPPHVVRGFCGKQKKQTRVEEYETEKSHVIKRTLSDIPVPVVRAAWPDGRIVTYGEAPPVEDGELDEDKPNGAEEEDDE
jgi:hypothetical protein